MTNKEKEPEEKVPVQTQIIREIFRFLIESRGDSEKSSPDFRWLPKNGEQK